jgi:hypothetical protein
MYDLASAEIGGRFLGCTIIENVKEIIDELNSASSIHNAVEEIKAKIPRIRQERM